MDTIETEKQFEEKVMKETTPVLVQFWAHWCKPCQLMSPVIEDVQREYGDRLKVCRVDVDRTRGIVTRFGVITVPTLILFMDGEPALRILGFQTKRDLSRQVGDRLEMAPGA